MATYAQNNVVPGSNTLPRQSCEAKNFPLGFHSPKDIELQGNPLKKGNSLFTLEGMLVRFVV